MSVPGILRGCPLFYELYEKEIEKIVNYCTVYSFEPGSLIVKELEEGDSIFVLVDGEASVEKNLPEGRVKIQPLNSGDVFGELALMGEKNRSADIVAVTVCHVLEVGYSDIFSLYKKDPSIFGLLLLNISRLITQRLRASNQIIVHLRQKALQAEQELLDKAG